MIINKDIRKVTKKIRRKAFDSISLALFTSLLMTATMLTSCSDFFSPDADDQLDADTYISDNTELYMGFLGLMTKLQAAGDKEILLTDTRAEFLEPTLNAGADLYALYDYKDDLKGNSLASPAEYYEIIIACNDYLDKVETYRKQPQVDQDICRALISSALRLKVWAYKTLGEVYGEAAWFDKQINNVEEFLKGEQYEMLGMEQISERCFELLENGYDDVPANLRVDWVRWLDKANENSQPSSSFYDFLFMVPDYGGLYTEVALWRAAYLDKAGDKQQAAVYYKKAADVITATLNEYVNMTSPYLSTSVQRNTLIANSGTDKIGSSVYWMPSAATPGAYKKIWLQENPDRYEMASVIKYMYENNQTNRLVEYFNCDAPAKYLLAPSEAGMLNFTDKTNNPGGSESDTRYKSLVKDYGTGKYVAKFRSNGGDGTVRTKAYMADVHIYTYRATQYYLLLCEALNNLGRFTALDCILNKGFTDNGYTADLVFLDTLDVVKLEQIVPDAEKRLNTAKDSVAALEASIAIETDADRKAVLQTSLEEQRTEVSEAEQNLKDMRLYYISTLTHYNQWKDEFEGFTRNWTNSPEWGARKYYFSGLRGAYVVDGLQPRTILSEGNITVAKRHNDIEILKEALLELSCEGKTLPWMNRVAVRYGEPGIVADMVCPKYEATGKAGAIRAKIEAAGGSWVKYPLK